MSFGSGRENTRGKKESTKNIYFGSTEEEKTRRRLNLIKILRRIVNNCEDCDLIWFAVTPRALFEIVLEGETARYERDRALDKMIKAEKRVKELESF